MLLRLLREGPLVSPRPWEMRTIRSLRERGLVRPRLSNRDAEGLWFISGKGRRALGGPEALASRHPTAAPAVQPRTRP
ncbi:hypothetical protein ACLBXO_30330 [Methylobacterium sp. C33D]|uniref:hypothetical protein n=1 Tax=Methylobacterium mesophilicum TaxID=39956 RepID=UPI002F33B440